MAEKALARQLLSALKSHGAREVFGIPGDFALPFFKVLEESAELPLFTLSHEPAVGFAADASSRIRSNLGVAAVTYGAGALNMVNSVAAAYAEKSPVVVISGGPGRAEASSGLLLHHQARSLDSQARIYQEVTCAQTRLDDPATAPQEIARVLRAAMTNSRPVYIEVPRDMVNVPCAAVEPLPPASFDPEALAACADEVLQRLLSANKPAVLVGVEIRRFDLEKQVSQLLHRLGVPVVTSLLGRGLLAHSQTPPWGTYLGAAGDPAITSLIEESDGLLMLGVILSDTNLGVSVKQIDRRKAMLAVDGGVTINYHTYSHIPLAALVEALLERTEPQPKTYQPSVGPNYPTGLSADSEPVTPWDIATAVNDLMDRHGSMPIAADIGDCMFTGMDIEPTDFVAPGYYATMGFGVPAGLGLQAATGRRPLIMVGDGAFQMTGWELGNCRRYGWNPIVIVFNNASWEMLRAFQPESAFNSLDEWDFARLATGLGGNGSVVRTRAELANALQQAMAQTDRFFLIDVRMPRGVMSPTLRRYVEGIQKGRGGQKA